MTFKAVDTINYQALKSEQNDYEIINRILTGASIHTDIELLINKLLYACDVTVNFHPDRFSNNGKLIIENLLKILIGCGEDEKQLVLGAHNNSEYMKGILIRRDV